MYLHKLQNVGQSNGQVEQLSRRHTPIIAMLHVNVSRQIRRHLVLNENLGDARIRNNYYSVNCFFNHSKLLLSNVVEPAVGLAYDCCASL